MIDMRDVLYTTDRLETIMILDKKLRQRLVHLEERIEEIQLPPTLLHQVLVTLSQIVTSLLEMREPLQVGQQLLEVPHLEKERGYLKTYLRAARLKVGGLWEDTTELEMLCADMCREEDGLGRQSGWSKL